MDEKEPLKITTTQDVAVVDFQASSVSGVSGIEEISKRISEYILDNYPKKIVMDFSSVKFLSSQALGMLLDVWRKLQTYNGRVVISGINPQLHRVFKITNLDKIFKFYSDRESAIESIKSS